LNFPQNDSDFVERTEDGVFEIQYIEINQSNKSVKKEKYSIKELQDIYDKYGPTSIQFFEQVKKLLIYLQHRYLNRYDLDCLHDCYVRLIESFQYWDPSRCNIVSWVHMVVRNRISSFCHSVKKKQKESGVLEDTIIDPYVYEGIHDRDKIRVFLTSFNRITIEGNEDLSEVISTIPNHPITQGSLWEVWSCQKKPIAKKKRSVISMQWT